MKKGKVFSKGHIITAALVVCLAAAVWMNMKFSSFSSPTASNDKNLGDAQYYDANSNLGEAVQTSAGVDMIVSARNDRNTQRNSTVKSFTEIIENSSSSEEAKNQALDGLGDIAENISKESSVETVIKAKGFSDALVIISEESVTVIVPSENLLPSETLQIQDAVTSQIDMDLEKIKIITVK